MLGGGMTIENGGFPLRGSQRHRFAFSHDARMRGSTSVGS